MSAMTRARAAIPVVCALTLVAGATSHSAASAGGPDRAASTGRLLVTLATPTAPAPPSAAGEPSAPAAEVLELRDDRLEAARAVIERVVDRNDLELTRALPEIGVIVVDPEGVPREELIRELRADPLVVEVGVERRVQLRFTPNDPAFTLRDGNAPGDDYFLWPLRRYHAQEAWNLSRGGGARVAVIDTGAYVDHPDLSGNLAGRLDCSGAVDDADDCIPGGDVTDVIGHGTHTAGLACADTNDGLGVASLGFRCNLDVIRTDLSFGAITAAILAATNRGADAISMSFGGGFDGPMVKALNYAYNGGAVLVAAGANDPSPSPNENYPAQWVQQEGSGPNINAGRGLVVTMAKHDGTRNLEGQKNTGVSVAAFGSATDQLSGGQQGIVSTWPPLVPPPTDEGLLSRTTIDGDNRYAYLVGTSMATPQVAGLVALIRHVRPRMSNDRVARLIKRSADGRGDYGRGLGWGIIDANAALGAALARDVIRPRSRVRSARVRGASAAARRPRLILRLKRFDPRRPGVPTSGVRIVSVFVSVNGGRYKRFRKTRSKRIRFRGRRGRDYRFYTRAVDRAGNREASPRRADVSLRLG